MSLSQRYNPRARKMFSYNWSDDNVVVPTPARLIHRLAFQRASKQVAAILVDAEQTATWQQRFQAQTRCKFFRPFIVGELLTKYKTELREELEQHGTLNGQPLANLLSSQNS